ncbi:MAG: B12-binding domain-containing radical SAM protein [Desulfobacteraceae bacterium]|nr:B12-binding domain-containing radical SAM protein [Desulfobacteraceae bacterium]
MSIRVLVIWPGLGLGGWNSYGNQTFAPTSCNINHGVASIIASLKSEGYETFLLDCRRLSGFDELEERVTSVNADVVAISGFSEDYYTVNSCIEIAKRVSAKCKVVVGGVHASLCPDDFLSNSQVDHVLIGEGEITFPDVLKKLSLGDTVDRLIKCEKPNLDNISFCDREIFDYTKELNYQWFGHKLKNYLPTPTVTMIVGRGCPYECAFCQPSEKLIFGKNVRMRSVSNVIEELKILQARYKYRSIVFHDDCLMMFRRWILNLAEELKSLGGDLSFFAAARADNICKNPEVLVALKEVGLKVVSIGFESGNQRTLDFIKKGTTVEQNLRAAEICQELGLAIFGNFMFGTPGETKEEAMDTVRMIKQIDPEVKSINLFTPALGSYLYDYCKQKQLTFKDTKYQPRSTRSIKGINYDFLENAIEEALCIHPVKRVIRRAVRSKPIRWLYDQIKTKPVLGLMLTRLKYKLQDLGLFG